MGVSNMVAVKIVVFRLQDCCLRCPQVAARVRMPCQQLVFITVQARQLQARHLNVVAAGVIQIDSRVSLAWCFSVQIFTWCNAGVRSALIFACIQVFCDCITFMQFNHIIVCCQSSRCVGLLKRRSASGQFFLDWALCMEAC